MTSCISVQTLLQSSLPPGGMIPYQPTPPDDPLTGQLWFNTSTNLLTVWTGTAWLDISTPNNLVINLAGGTANQVLVKKSSADYDYGWEDMIINWPPTNYTKLLDQVNATLLYVGEALPDSLEFQPVWRISRIIFDTAGNVDELRYADGGEFNQIWNDRTSLIYI